MGHFKSPEAKARALANLAPWKPGVSPNPGGIPGNGRSRRKPSGRRLTPKFLHAALLKRLREGGDYRRLIDKWVTMGIEGNVKALQLLLPYILPLEGQQNGGKVVFEGIKLELSSEDGKSISATMLSGSAPASLAAPEEEEPRDLEAE